jgi:hypothetical protein
MIRYPKYALQNKRTGSGLFDTYMIYANRAGRARYQNRSGITVLDILSLAMNGKTGDPQVPANPCKIHWDCRSGATGFGHIIINNRHVLTSAGESNILRDINLRAPYKRSCGERNRIAVLRLCIVDELHICRCAVGIVHRGLAAIGKANQNKNTYKGQPGGRLHNCGLSVVAILRSPRSYQNQLPWQEKTLKLLIIVFGPFNFTSAPR